MAKIIIIKGTMNTGKTTTASIVYSQLLSICDKIHQFNGEEVTTNSLVCDANGNVFDFTALLTYNGKKIGIISAGDVLSSFKIQIEILIKIKVDIIICCSRSQYRTNSVYAELVDNYGKQNPIELKIFTKYSENDQEKINIKKDVVAEIIKKTIELAEN